MRDEELERVCGEWIRYLQTRSTYYGSDGEEHPDSTWSFVFFGLHSRLFVLLNLRELHDAYHTTP